mmetsp:Transcript_1302/g.2698  ORF Transcript_1302/g.2698 Transcript_1302/m.2698 type:complete len:748 (-) Transcript_1302:183-2426(-)
MPGEISEDVMESEMPVTTHGREGDQVDKSGGDAVDDLKDDFGGAQDNTEGATQASAGLDVVDEEHESAGADAAAQTGIDRVDEADKDMGAPAPSEKSEEAAGTTHASMAGVYGAGDIADPVADDTSAATSEDVEAGADIERGVDSADVVGTSAGATDDASTRTETEHGSNVGADTAAAGTDESKVDVDHERTVDGDIDIVTEAGSQAGVGSIAEARMDGVHGSDAITDVVADAETSAGLADASNADLDVERNVEEDVHHVAAVNMSVNDVSYMNGDEARPRAGTVGDVAMAADFSAAADADLNAVANTSAISDGVVAADGIADTVSNVQITTESVHGDDLHVNAEAESQVKADATAAEVDLDAVADTEGRIDNVAAENMSADAAGGTRLSIGSVRGAEMKADTVADVETTPGVAGAAEMNFDVVANKQGSADGGTAANVSVNGIGNAKTTMSSVHGSGVDADTVGDTETSAGVASAPDADLEAVYTGDDGDSVAAAGMSADADGSTSATMDGVHGSSEYAGTDAQTKLDTAAETNMGLEAVANKEPSFDMVASDDMSVNAVSDSPANDDSSGVDVNVDAHTKTGTSSVADQGVDTTADIVASAELDADSIGDAAVNADVESKPLQTSNDAQSSASIEDGDKVVSNGAAQEALVPHALGSRGSEDADAVTVHTEANDADKSPKVKQQSPHMNKVESVTSKDVQPKEKAAFGWKVSSAGGMHGQKVQPRAGGPRKRMRSPSRTERHRVG